MILSNQPIEEMNAPEILKEIGAVYAGLQMLEEPENFYQDGERTAEEGQWEVDRMTARLAKLEKALET